VIDVKDMASSNLSIRMSIPNRENYLVMFQLKKAKGHSMGLKEWYMKRMVRGMSREEKQSMMEKMMDEFFASMTSEDKKELMKQMMPKMMEKMMEGMTAEDKQELMGSMMPSMMTQMFAGMKDEEKSKIMEKMMPTMMSQMFGGEGGMPTMMMQMMKSMMGGEKEGEKRQTPCMPAMETQEGFKPWEFCPCRKLCEKAFKKKSKG